MKKFLFFLIFNSAFLILNSFSQAPDYQWAKSIGGLGYDFVFSVDVNDSGHVYTTGRFSQTVDFDPDVAQAYNLTWLGGSDIFILKLDPNGNFVWAKKIGGVNNDVGRSIAVDASGYTYTTGGFQGSVDFNPDTNVAFPITSNGNDDIFIIKLDAAGNLVWAKTVGGSGIDVAYSLAIEPSNKSVYVTGVFQGTVDFDPGPGLLNLTSSGNNGIFILKLDSAGNTSWAKSLGGPGDDLGASVAVDASGNVYTTGVFEATADFDPGAGTTNLISSGNHDIFFSKLDSSGNLVWAKAIGAAGDDWGRSVCIDHSGNFYSTGFFDGTVDFNPGAGTSNLVSAGESDIFIARFDTSGNYVWARNVGGPIIDYGNNIVYDSSGNGSVYSTGVFAETADFNPDASVTFNLISVGNSDGFISKLDASGNFQWAKSFGGTNYDYATAVALDNSSHPYLAGNFNSLSIALGPITLVNADVNTFYYDFFISKLDTALLTSVGEIVSRNEDALLFPNPAIHQVTVSSGIEQKMFSVTILDVTGKIVYVANAKETSFRIDTKDFAEGMYFVRMQSDEFIKTKKLIVKK